jgi:protein-disulfide isomerase
MSGSSLTRRKIVASAALLGAAGALGLPFVRPTLAGAALAAPAAASPPNDLFDDPDSPVAGNAHGAVTVVEFFDYRCPYCRLMEPRIRDLLAQDPSVRLVLKDWPIFGETSVYAAQVAVAARWQGKYLPVHDALFGLPRTMDKTAILDAVAKAGVDLTRLDHDLSQRRAEIDRILGRVDMEANALQLQGTPAFVVGHQLAPGSLSLEELKQLVAEAKTGN